MGGRQRLAVIARQVDRKRRIVWEKTGLKNPGDATKLPNGNVLIGEYAGKSVLEVDRKGKILWRRACPAAVSGLCVLPDGTIAITNSKEGAILLNRDGTKVIRNLLAHNGLPVSFMRLSLKWF